MHNTPHAAAGCLPVAFPQLAANPASAMPASISDAAVALAGRIEAKGLSLRLSDSWQELQDVNERNANSWFPLLPRPTGSTAHWIAAHDADGQIVATQGAVLLDCSSTSFGERLADLTAFHAPNTAPAGEWCFCASDPSFETRGQVAFVVAGWIHPGWRGHGLFHPMAALMRYICWMRWEVNWWAGLVDPETVPVWQVAGAGRRRLDPRPTILYHQTGVGRLPLHLLRFSRAGVTLDAATVLARAKRVA